jgi:hypothetical protein
MLTKVGAGLPKTHSLFFSVEVSPKSENKFKNKK